MDFFDETEYVEREFEFATETGVLKQKALGWVQGGCNVVWGDLLCWYLARNPELCRGRRVIELGAGCGLVGLLAAQQGAASVLLTDGDEAELPLLRENATRYGEGTVTAAALAWGEAAAVPESGGTPAAKEVFDLVLAQEV